ncbi:tetratricopeptide repeat protein [Streptomyces turgidiscabies Car8]|uniref:Tetratricopeptide repeat protein n=1 Tax=Streptomyces turgidiscabies (strain Car8) TaxID=698760 RepID=L7F1R5_STRT8|nr:tetratricopeptide repeat protein [Streptomyces turgidiscabies Car8]
MAPVVVLALVATVVALLELEEPPSWLGWCPPWAAAVVVAVLGVAGTWSLEQWAQRRQDVAAQEQVAVDRLRRHLGRQEGLPQVGERGAGGLLLGIHEALPLEPMASAPAAVPAVRRLRALGGGRQQRGETVVEPDVDLPVFVERDVSEQLRSWMRTAGRDGGFIVLVGNSCVGKTRLLFESARAELADFAVLAPDLGDGGLVNALAEASFPLPKLMVWLDELQRFLSGPFFVNDEGAGHAPLSASAVRKLLAADTPVVIVGTLWPEYATELRATELAPDTGAQHPRYPAAVDILGMGGVRDLVVQPFSPTERARAATLAARDPRLAHAVADRDYNVTEALAGARQIMRRYQQATDVNQAVIHAAIDARRLGIQGPLTRELLCAAARGYFTTVEPDDTWFERALAELSSSSRRDDRATAPLIPLPTADRRAVLGYTVADYLQQRLAWRRRSEQLSALTWQALVEHTADLDDRLRLADGAYRRLVYGAAETLYRALAFSSSEAALELADLLDDQGKTEEALEVLRAIADTSEAAAGQLARLLADCGRIDELRERADAGDRRAAQVLADVLAEQGDVAGLRVRADAGDADAVDQLIGLLDRQNDTDELRRLADAGDGSATDHLALVLRRQGDIDELQRVLRARADAGDHNAAFQLADLVSEQGDTDEALRVLRVHAEMGSRAAVGRLSESLIRRGHVDEALQLLRSRADAGDAYASIRLAVLLAEQGRVDELRIRAGAGDYEATDQLADLLIRRGDTDEALKVLGDLAETGDRSAANRVEDLLRRQGNDEEALQQLRNRAESGDLGAFDDLTWRLVEQGDVDEALRLLRTRADAGEYAAALGLARFLGDHSRLDELRARADAGERPAADRLVSLLAEQEDLEALYAEVHAGTEGAARELITFLEAHGEKDTAQQLCTRGFALPEDPT